MILHSIVSGPVDTVGYLVADDVTRSALIIDVPLGSAARWVDLLRRDDLTPVGIVLTHGHFDHVGDVAMLARELAVPVHIHPLDAPLLENPGSDFPQLGLSIEGLTEYQTLETGDFLECGRLRLRVIHAPGHTHGHVVLYEMRENILFSGDVLFHMSIGRYDLGGDYDTLLHSITAKLLVLPDETIVYPGHGASTSIGYEREHNPFIREYLDHL
ncbi:MAG: MBL fold metallo-hydrolase [Bacteroidota bacterium]|jgi:glyoxylase-like metal-dependent hydrolase (beta-lactamase superfamily II)|nr:MBL fold metallo-hydrolase [Bacteroidota bacterium]